MAPTCSRDVEVNSAKPGGGEMLQESTQTEKLLLIRPIRCECTSASYCELCRAIEHLGGVKCKDAFAFHTVHERAAAAELLGDRFGTRYFEVS